ncbi:MAG: thymidine phosphorylase [Thermotogae bacterium]|nr:thymidine phosphorylase [Thermotogota bacterium]
MNALEIIRKKRDGLTLSEDELRHMVFTYTFDNLPDYQMAAFLMASFIRGLNDDETLALTRAMIDSGKPITWNTELPRVDKHSTGGVGDKVSIPLAPLVASYDVLVPMISGRALGHTGGTLDKLESIPGYRTDLSVQEFKKVVMGVGASIIGQTDELAPADRKMYALRDATATVESVPLISASIMSKKLSEGLTGLVLDVKTGSGAFMENYADALKLARAMVSIGNGYGVKTVALLTNMDVPLGWAAGNACEICESVQLLKGRGPDDLKEIVVTLGGWMLKLARKVENVDTGKELIEEAIRNGEGLKRFRRMVEAHGGDFAAVEREDFIQTRYEAVIKAHSDGYIAAMDTKRIGWATVMLGAGRLKKEDTIDHKVCIFTLKKTGDRVRRGDTIFRVFANDEAKLEKAIEMLEESFALSETKPEPKPLIYEVVE